MSLDRGWMYRRYAQGSLTGEFMDGLEVFIHYALSRPDLMIGNKIKCPCTKCKNKKFDTPMTVRVHLAKNGFIPRYHIWTMHGEALVQVPDVARRIVTIEEDREVNRYETMVMDVATAQFHNVDDLIEESPNPTAQHLYDMLKAADRELWPGCKTHTQLSLVARLMSLKSDNNMSERCFDQILELIKEIVPDNNLVTGDFYSAKKLLRGMGLPVEKIDCCRNNCMLFWGDDESLNECKFCDANRYKESSGPSGSRQRRLVAVSQMHYFPITPRLQRLYASKATAADMRWHATSVNDGVMRHPADSPAWKHFDNTFPDFAAEVRNVRLGLCTDGFSPFNNFGKQYSSWPILLTPYNLPPWMCMREQHIFLTAVVPGPHNPKDMIDVFLQPLIAELSHLWEVGVQAYDISLKNNFQMRAALLWTISDFPAYSMLSGWSTAGRLACPRCCDDTDSFRLPLSGKQSWFDCHRRFLPTDHPFRRNKYAFIKNAQVRKGPPQTKNGYQLLAEIEGLGIKKVTELTVEETRLRISKRQRTYESGWRKKSIFWDLPYWSSLLIRHNLDVMHIEKNVFDNLFNTIMNTKGKTKDTAKSREELNRFCRRPELEANEQTGKYPKACYMLDNDEKRILLKWIEGLRFPDGYVSSLGRCVNLSTLQMFGMKSHDCHVMMQRVLPVALKDLLPFNVWKTITDLCLFFKDLTSPNIQVDNLLQMQKNIPVILCKLERIFPPSFFDSMEHLPIHLADEAMMAGPVQYRWMYPFERYLGKLKKTVKNKAKVEGSITNAYLVEEATAFCCYYSIRV
ncbi:uncharacterized protein LOC131018985 [Salvia miltiorrhiza]|uniref:uncharacterized protein LOC131018984 n=1 Tax=Salvia miltiorrhiza TaxID=226208 RepID=UPI0025AC217E|nr:uncharacterized protein LOC131018984 [Salvia miltiorrhiza]XP_057803653.1 uncharacterized protein LOC131018985 [Salvia miltiorrhiza]